jgi:hypothetical protein
MGRRVCVCQAAFTRHKEEEVYLSKLMCIILLLKKMSLCFMAVVYRFTQNVYVCICAKREREKQSI